VFADTVHFARFVTTVPHACVQMVSPEIHFHLVMKFLELHHHQNQSSIRATRHHAELTHNVHPDLALVMQLAHVLHIFNMARPMLNVNLSV